MVIMFYLMMAFFNGADITVAGILTSFGVVTLGNFIGGGIIVAGADYFLDQDLRVAKPAAIKKAS